MRAELSQHLQYCSKCVSRSNSLNPHHHRHLVLLVLPSEMENLHQATSCNFWAGKHEHGHGVGGAGPCSSHSGVEKFDTGRGDSKGAKERIHVI